MTARAEKDFNVKVTVRSARVLNAITEAFGTQADMSRATGIPHHQINKFVTMRETPVGEDGWKDSAETFAAALGKYPSDLWPEHMQNVKLRRATAELSMDTDEVQAVMDGGVDRHALRDLLTYAAGGLNERYMKVLQLSLEGATSDEIAQEFGVSRGRAHQMLMSAQQKMRDRLKLCGITSAAKALE